MGAAMLKGLLVAGWSAETVVGVEPSLKRRAEALSHGIQVYDNADEIPISDVVVLAVKPVDVALALQPLALRDGWDKTLLVSLAAGVATQTLTLWWGASRPCVRAMPNLGATIRHSATAAYARPGTGPEAKSWATTVLGSVGQVSWCTNEADLDIVTALSGSGIAYVAFLMEAMVAEAIELGLSPAVARLLTLETVQATPLLLKDSGDDPSDLRRKVSSPGGTTEAAVAKLVEGGVDTKVREAIRAAWRRARTLAEKARGDGS